MMPGTKYVKQIGEKRTNEVDEHNTAYTESQLNYTPASDASVIEKQRFKSVRCFRFSKAKTKAPHPTRSGSSKKASSQKVEAVSGKILLL